MASNDYRFTADYAKSNRSRCKECKRKIEKDTLRMGIMTESSNFDGRIPVWYHYECFWRQIKSVEMKTESDVHRFDNLRWVDQEKLRTKMNDRKRSHANRSNDEDAGPSKVMKAESAKNVQPTLEEVEKLALKEQNDNLWKLRDQLNSTLTKKDLAKLLTHNSQIVPSGNAKILDRLTDCMLFGVPKACEECNGGQLVFSTTRNSYVCTGSVSGFTRCQFSVAEPKRLPFVIPEGYQDNYFLANFEFKSGRQRMLSAGRQPLGDIGLNHPMILRSQSYNADGSTAKCGASSKSSESGEEFSTFSKLVLVSQKVIGGAAVDPDFEFSAVAHIYQVKDLDKDIYNAILSKVDIQNGRNSYYKLQLLEHDNAKKYWLYRAWGRTGTSVGGTKVEDFGTALDNAKEAFKRLYLKKTGNHWHMRAHCEKKPYLFFPLDIDYGQKSKLPEELQDLVTLIFDIDQMKQTMMEFEIDLKKMPLGKLSKKQIQEAYGVLTELEQMLAGERNQTKILDCSNRFFTLIPHDFGTKKPLLLDNTEIVKIKTEMLDNLLEIELAYGILKGDTGETDPIDAHYAKLNTDIGVLDKTSDEFKMVQDYVKNTHDVTQSDYALDVVEVFTTNRQGEADRCALFKDLHNRMLLWHGSRLSNYVGILSEGLRIAPPGAPATGCMFGKGLYFADMVAKSSIYCYAKRSNSVGLMLLCEVALGNMQEIVEPEVETILLSGKHSVKGVGQSAPDPIGDRTLENGTVVPMGKGVTADDDALNLLYNEYVVYDASQVNIKYLVKVKFNYKN